MRSGFVAALCAVAWLAAGGPAWAANVPSPRVEGGARDIFDIYERPAAAAPDTPAAQATAALQGARSIAIVVGLSDYGRHWAPLQESFEDAKRMRAFLIGRAGFDYVVTLTNRAATKERIRRYMVDEIPARVRPGDRFLFYFSGHGTQRSSGRRTTGYLPMLESPPQRFSTMIGMDELESWWRNLDRARHTLFLLDACFSGIAGVTAKSAPRQRALEELVKPGHHVFTAGGANQESYASLEKWGGSLFTTALIEGMAGKADFAAQGIPRDGIVSLTELKTYVRGRIAQELTGQADNIRQWPQESDLMGGRSEGEFFFVTPEKAARVSATSPPEGGQVRGKGVAGAEQDAEAMAWYGIARETDPAFFEAFLEAFPDGRFAALARLKIAKASGGSEPAAATASSQPEAAQPVEKGAPSFLARLFGGGSTDPSPAAAGPGWARLFQGREDDAFAGVVVLPDGRAAMAGRTRRSGREYGWLAALGPAGDTLEDRIVEGADGIGGAVRLRDGGLMLAGHAFGKDGGAAGGVLMRVAPGAPTRPTVFGGAGHGFGAVDAASDGGVVAAGVIEGGPNGDRDGWIARVDAGGRVLWQVTPGGRGRDEIRAVRATPDGGAVAAGLSESGGAGAADGWLVRLDAKGRVLWQRRLGGDRPDVFNDLALAADGGAIAVGTTASRSFDDNDVWAVRVDADGRTVWDETYGNTSYDEARAVTPAHGGGWVLVGWTRSRDTGLDDGWVIGLDDRGDRRWDERHGGVDHDRLHAIRPTPDGGYIAVGAAIRASVRGWDGWVVKLDSRGRMTGESAPAGPPASALR